MVRTNASPSIPGMRQIGDAEVEREELLGERAQALRAVRGGHHLEAARRERVAEHPAVEHVVVHHERAPRPGGELDDGRVEPRLLGGLELEADAHAGVVHERDGRAGVEVAAVGKPEGERDGGADRRRRLGPHERAALREVLDEVLLELGAAPVGDGRAGDRHRLGGAKRDPPEHLRGRPELDAR